MNINDLIYQLKKLLDKNKSALIIIPTPPDIDAVASAVVLADFLQTKSIQVKLISRQTLPAYYQPIIDHWSVGQSINDSTSDLVFMIDCPTIRNTGFASELENKRFQQLILIDHHPKSDLYKLADLKIWHEGWSSGSQAVFYLLSSFGKLNAKQATLLYLALLADTGAFQHRVNVDTYKVASRLLSAGANRFWVTNFLAKNKTSIDRLRLLGEISRQARLIAEWDLLLATIDRTMLTKYAAGENNIEGLIGFLEKQNLAKVVILIVEDKDSQIRGFIRSSDKNRPAGRIAKLFGGSGFDRAGGFIIKKTFATLS